MFRPTSKPARAAAKAAAVSLSAVTACAATPATLASAAPAPVGTVARQPVPGEETEAGTAGPHDVVFVQTSGEKGNQVVAYTRTTDGTLREQGSYETRGEGGRLRGAEADGHQASQGSLAYDPREGILIAANSGSGTVSVFEVDGAKLTLRQVTPSGGGFPASIAVHDGVAYVLNAGTGGSVQGFTIDGPRLEPIAGSRRELGLSTDRGPLQYTRTPGQVGFTDDGSRLVVTTKANGSLQVFDVDDDGLLSAEPVTNDLAPRAPFAFTTGEDGRLVVADATNAVDTFTLWKDDTVRRVDTADTGAPAASPATAAPCTSPTPAATPSPPTRSTPPAASPRSAAPPPAPAPPTWRSPRRATTSTSRPARTAASRPTASAPTAV
ncbi:hypothetical protein J2S52_002201 [Streptomyces sp. DSM 41037]|nr:hypothetical protein [Streptomyces sp. DSM 41037]